MPRKATDNHRGSHITFRCEPAIYDLITNIATSRNCNKSDVLRSLVDDGLKVQNYKQDDDYMYNLVKAAVQDSLQQPIERLAKISAKGSQAAAAAFFMSVASGVLRLPPKEKEEFEEVAARAKELGIQFLKAGENHDLDSLIISGTKEMTQIHK